MTPSARRRAALIVCARILALPEFKEAKIIALYAHFRQEVPTARLALMSRRAGKEVALPMLTGRSRNMAFHLVTDRHQLCPGPYGIRQPAPGCREVSPAEVDLICLPGLGFDRVGYRLGYGGGYYDRFLPRLRPDCLRVGVAFACQVVSILPHGALDCPVDAVITEAEVIRVGTFRA